MSTGRRAMLRPRGAVEGRALTTSKGLTPVNCNFLLNPAAMTDLDSSQKHYRSGEGAVTMQFDGEVPDFKDFAFLMLMMSFAKKASNGGWYTYFSSLYELQQAAGLTLNNKATRALVDRVVDIYWAASITYTNSYVRHGPEGEKVLTSSRHRIITSERRRKVCHGKRASLEIEIAFDRDFMESHMERYRRFIDAKVLYHIPTAMGKALYCFLWTRMYNTDEVAVRLSDLADLLGKEQLRPRNITASINKAISAVNDTIVKLNSQSGTLKVKARLSDSMVCFRQTV